MTESELDKYKQNLQSIIDKLHSLKVEMEYIETGESETMSDPPAVLDDGDIENWIDILQSTTEDINSLSNELNSNL